jgi:hypothetical protein
MSILLMRPVAKDGGLSSTADVPPIEESKQDRRETAIETTTT